MGIKNRTKQNEHKRGATIVETLVALSIFALFVAGAAKVIVMQSKITDKSQAHFIAINIAKNQIEQVRNLRRSDFSQILLLQETGTRVNEKGEADPNGQFSRITTIQRDARNDFLIEVEVRVNLINRVTLNFDGEHEVLKSYIAHLLNA